MDRLLSCNVGHKNPPTHCAICYRDVLARKDAAEARLRTLELEVKLLRDAIDKSNVALAEAVETKEGRDRLLLQNREMRKLIERQIACLSKIIEIEMRVLRWIRCLLRGHKFPIEVRSSDILWIEGRLVVSRPRWVVVCRCGRVEADVTLRVTYQNGVATGQSVSVGEPRRVALKV